jgi:hypothetical protein
VDSNRASTRASVPGQPGNKKYPGMLRLEVTGQPGKIGSATKSYNKELGGWSQIAGSSLAGQFHVTGLMQHYRLRNQNGRRGTSRAYRAIASNRAAGQKM